MVIENPRLSEIASEVIGELERARSLHKPLSSWHEGYAVLLEEVDEMWAEIKGDDHIAAREECIQVAATALRMLIDLD
jgi:hypothetical protein